MNVQITSNISVGGLSIYSQLSRSCTGQIGQELAGDNILPLAPAGTLTTRTDDNTGILTMAANHGIENQDVVDVYWATGLRRGMVATVTINSVAIEGGAGDALPDQATAVTVGVCVALDMDVDGDLVVLAAARCDLRGCLTFLDDQGDEIPNAAVELTAAEAWTWADGQSIDNPLAGAVVASIRVSNGGTAAANFAMGVGYDSNE